MVLFVVEVYDQHTGRIESQHCVWADSPSSAKIKFLAMNPKIDINIRHKRLVIASAIH